jgi:hypothetical protein
VYTISIVCTPKGRREQFKRFFSPSPFRGGVGEGVKQGNWVRARVRVEIPFCEKEKE